MTYLTLHVPFALNKANTLLYSAKNHTLHRNACYQTLKYQILNYIFNLLLIVYKWLLLSSYFLQKPTFCTKTLHSQQGQSSGFHCFMAFLSLSKSHISFRLLGTRSHIFGTRFEILSVPWYNVFIRGLENWQSCLRI